MSYNYILVRVEEPDDLKSTMFATRSGLIRQAIHDFAQRNGISVADNLIRSDRTEFLWGAKVPYAETEELFNKIVYKGNL